MEKEKRKKYIIQRIKELNGATKHLRIEKSILERERSFMNGHYDKTWEEEYLGAKE